MTDDTIELIAEAIFPAMVLAATTFATDCPPDWVKGGNSFVQDEARRAAMRALSAMPQQEVTVKDAAKVLLSSPKPGSSMDAICLLIDKNRDAPAYLLADGVIGAFLRAISEGE